MPHEAALGHVAAQAAGLQAGLARRSWAFWPGALPRSTALMSGPPAKVQCEPAKAVTATAMVIVNTSFFIGCTPFL
jgi:hypothetical protein